MTSNQRTCADHHGGVFVGWSARHGVSGDNDDVYAQRVAADGMLFSGFPLAGVPICTNPDYQAFGVISLDTQEGVVLAWLDYRSENAPNFPTLYAQRLESDGEIALGWPADGVSITQTLVDQSLPVLVPDASAGVFLVWTDLRTGNPDLYIQHLTSNGALANGWQPDGRLLTSLPGPRANPFAFADGNGGLILAWSDGRPGAAGIYVGHVTGSGDPAPGWPEGGVRVAIGRSLRGLVTDGAGGGYLALKVSSTTYVGFDAIYFILRFTDTGAIAPGWLENGTTVCNAPDFRDGPLLTADGQGGAYLDWDDYRGLGASTIYAVRMLPNGSFAPGWDLNGIQVSAIPGFQFNGDLLADGLGGVYLAFEVGTDENRSYVQHLSGNGAPAPGWTREGALLNQQAGDSPRLATDGSSGVIVTWYNQLARNVYAQHFVTDGVVATELALLSADAQPDRVTLVWQGDGAPTAAATVERRTEATMWLRIGIPTREGQDRLQYEDRDIAAGSRYAYRLAYVSSGTPRSSPETWIDVPTARLALLGLRPNPATGPLSVSFALPDASPASLELLDVGGRRLMQREVGSLGAGSHIVRLDEGASLPPGIYWVRLRHGGRSLLSRGAIVR